MKKSVIISGLTILLQTVACHARAEVIAGPITNPANGHDYFLLAPCNWTAAEKEAENLGGTLAIINDVAEQNWVLDQFSNASRMGRGLWIGLHRQGSGGDFVWIDGSKTDYANWSSGQPDNGGNNETCAYMWIEGNKDGAWNDGTENTTICGVVEVSGNAHERKLTQREKDLIGYWYESGKPDRQAWIVGTHSKLFLITHDHHVARLTFTRDGFISNADRLHGEVVKNKIVWSNGTWWSHQVSGYEAGSNANDAPEVLTGPIENPANGHEYFLLAPDSWTASEAKAEELGGTLAVIRNAAEQEWVFDKFGDFDGTNRSLWIGRRRSWPGAPFASVTDENVAFYHWDLGQPDDAGGREFCVQMLLTGKWNDNTDTANPVCGVVEVPGKSNEESLTKEERSLIGDWYNNGDPNQPCCVAGTENLLFAIDQNRGASRVIETPEGFFFTPQWKQHIVSQADKLLWSRGNWWSREPVEFKISATDSTDDDSGIGLKSEGK